MHVIHVCKLIYLLQEKGDAFGRKCGYLLKMKGYIDR